MRGRRFEVSWREEDTAEGLKEAYRGERDVRLRMRLQGLWLLRSGWGLAPVATAVGVHYRSVQRWVGWYREGGVAKVLSHRMGGKGQEPFLTHEAQEHVVKEVGTGRFRTAGEIREWIAEHYGVSYSIGGTYNLMRRLRCAPRVPRPLHAKADQEQQASWKKGDSRRRLHRLG